MLSTEFSQSDGFIYSLDPRIKIIILTLLALVTATGSNLLMLTQAFIFSLVLILAAGLNLARVIKRVSILNIFIIGIWLFVPFTYPGETLAVIGPLQITGEGVLYALRITLRSNAVMLAAFALLSTSSVSSLMQALEYFYVPQKLICLFFFVYRYIFVLKDEFSNMQNSVKSRGFSATTSLHSYKTYAFLIGMLLIKSYERASRVYRAMLARGYNGKFYIKEELEFSFSDMMVFSFGVILVGILFGWEYGIFI